MMGNQGDQDGKMGNRTLASLSSGRSSDQKEDNNLSQQPGGGHGVFLG